MDGTILGQGFFDAFYNQANPNPGVASNQAGLARYIDIPSGADWVKVYNYTKAGQNGLNTVYFQGTANALAGVEFYWQRGMAPGTGIVKYKSNAASTLNEDTLVSGGFTIFDPSGQSVGSLPLVGAPVATTASTNATRPVVSTASTAGLFIGAVVRMSNTAQTDVNGIDMVVGAITVNTNFTLLTATNPLANAPGAVGGAGFYRIINLASPWYPARRFVVDITQAVNPTVSTSVQHSYVAGQAVRFRIPAEAGMVQLNSTQENNFVYATVVSVVDDYNFIIDIDTSAFTAFTWPTIAQQPSSFPMVEPVGENTAFALASPQPQVPTLGGFPLNAVQSGILSDATTNTGFLGMLFGSGGNGNALGTPISGPAGTVHFTAGDIVDAEDRMFWVAGKSSYGGL